MTYIWAAEKGWFLLNYIMTDANVFLSTIGHAGTKLHELFCCEKTAVIFFNLSDEDFSKISRVVFKHICEKLLKHNFLDVATRVAGEFVITLDNSLTHYKNFSTKRSRCRGIVRGMLERIFLHLFQLSSSLGKVLWVAITALQELIQKHDAIEANSFFQVRTRRLSLFPWLFAECIPLQT
jgi:hypothetical protein